MQMILMIAVSDCYSYSVALLYWALIELFNWPSSHILNKYDVHNSKGGVDRIYLSSKLGGRSFYLLLWHVRRGLSLRKYNYTKSNSHMDPSYRHGTILWCINVSQYIMFQCVYWYCKLSIDASIYQYITVYWSLKCSVKSIINDSFVENDARRSLYYF